MGALVGNQIGVEICKALDIPHELVQRIELDFGAEDIVRAKVTRLVMKEHGSRLLAVLDSYTFQAVGK